MTQQEILGRLKQEIAARRYPNMTQDQFLMEAIDVMCGVIAEVLAKRPVLSLPRDKLK